MANQMQKPEGIVAKIANAQITKFSLVKLLSSDTSKVLHTAATGDPIFGIALEDAAAGAMVDVCTAGYCQVRVDGSGTNIAAHDFLMAGATAGVAVKLAGAAGTLRPVIGQALDPSTASGDYISAQVRQSSLQAA